VLPATPVDLIPDLLMRGVQAFRRALVRISQCACCAKEVTHVMAGDLRANVALGARCQGFGQPPRLVTGLVMQFGTMASKPRRERQPVHQVLQLQREVQSKPEAVTSSLRLRFCSKAPSSFPAIFSGVCVHLAFMAIHFATTSPSATTAACTPVTTTTTAASWGRVHVLGVHDRLVGFSPGLGLAASSHRILDFTPEFAIATRRVSEFPLRNCRPFVGDAPVVVGIRGVVVVFAMLHYVIDYVVQGVGKEWAPREIPGGNELPDFNIWTECFLGRSEGQGILLKLSVRPHMILLFTHTPCAPGFNVVVVDSADFVHEEVTQFPQDSHVLDSLELQRFEWCVLVFFVVSKLSVELTTTFDVLLPLQHTMG
jgi:hypothetical protein